MRRCAWSVLAWAIVCAVAGTATAIERRAVACQRAIAKAGRRFVDAELSSRGRCKLAATHGRACDARGRTASHESKLRRVVARCSGVRLSTLGAESCAARSANTSQLSRCLIDEHTAAVDTLLAAQFGRVGDAAEVVLSGRIASARSSLLPPAHLLRYKLDVAPVSLEDLSIRCVTFASDPEHASAPVDEDGRFTVRLAAVGVPFGCTVVEERSGEAIATMVFRAAEGDATHAQIDGAGELVLGTVSLDLATGEAVVDADGLDIETTCADGIDAPFDFTGTWTFECLPGPDGSGFACPPAGDRDGRAAPEEVFLHRVEGLDARGRPAYWLGLWESAEAFERCGRIEGLATASGGVGTSAGERLADPDGVFTFASEAAIEAAVDLVASPDLDGAIENSHATICRSTAPTCGLVQNNDGGACMPTLDGTAECWGLETSQGIRPYSDDECRAICYAANVQLADRSDSDGLVREALAAAGLCVERRHLNFAVAPGDDGFQQATGDPLGRHFLGRLVYSCDDAASLVRRDAVRTVRVLRGGIGGDAGRVCHVTRRQEISLSVEGAGRVVGTLAETASLAPGDPDACADVHDPTNPVAALLEPTRMLFVLTR